MAKKFYCLFLLLMITNGVCFGFQATLSLESLLRDMVDREKIAQYPEFHFKTSQASSYDRESIRRDTSTWFANWDRSQFVRVESNQGRKEFVMMDQTGPGAIVRFWMTFAGSGGGKGTLRIYLDNKEEPVLEGSAFEILSGGALVGPPLSASVSRDTPYENRGHNLYFPIPYAKHCKVTYESDNIKSLGARSDNESVYYNINYRTYDSDTDINIQSFALDQLKTHRNLIDSVQNVLKGESKQLLSAHSGIKSYNVNLGAGEMHSMDFEGPSSIRKIYTNIEAENIEQALRSTVISLSFDGVETAWLPIGSFFGTGYQIRKSSTWYQTVTESGNLMAYWVMPFRQKARIKLINYGNQQVTLKGDIVPKSWNWNNKSMHFGASWQLYDSLYTGEQKTMEGTGNPFDINYTKIEGKGVFVGDALTVFNTAYDWWGEGDEKIYIDGEVYPSHFGTGTEDYYGYAWVRPEKFINHPFISQPDGSGNITPGYTQNNRFRSLDVIPFKRKLDFDMELWHWTKTIIDYSPVAFYYIKPNGKSNATLNIEDVKKTVTLKRSQLINPTLSELKFEIENAIIEKVTGGALRFQYLREPVVSNNKQLWWRGAKPGDMIKIKFLSEQRGNFNASLNFVVAPDYGNVNIKLNGKTIIENLDLYNSKLDTRIINLTNILLKKGENTFTITMESLPNVEAKTAAFGWDYFKLKEI